MPSAHATAASAPDLDQLQRSLHLATERTVGFDGVQAVAVEVLAPG